MPLLWTWLQLKLQLETSGRTQTCDSDWDAAPTDRFKLDLRVPLGRGPAHTTGAHGRDGAGARLVAPQCGSRDGPGAAPGAAWPRIIPSISI